MSARRPLVGVIADRRMLGDHAFHLAGEKYLQALILASGVYPVVLPALTAGIDVPSILTSFDGLFLTGSPSNVEPRQYFGEASRPGTWHDPERDAKSLALIPAAIVSGLPLFAVCRGFQEMNVAFGGSLHQHVEEVAGYRDHREKPDDPLDTMYGPAHRVDFAEHGLLRQWTGHAFAEVNSLHAQGADVLGEGLRVEAVAEDGLIEAFTVADAPGFTLGVQWHPEWKVMDDPVSLAIFRAFGEACLVYGAKRSQA